MNTAYKWIRVATGATVLEYAFILIFIAAVCVAAVGLIGSGTNALFATARFP